jgi:hypothetical protein
MCGSSEYAASLLEVIASMDVPFDSPDLLALPAAGNNSPGQCAMASVNAHYPMVARAPPAGGNLNIVHECSGQTQTHAVMYGSFKNTAFCQDAESLLQVISSMDVPFRSPDLPVPPTAVTDSPGWCASMAPGCCASMSAHQTMHAGHDEENCIDCWHCRTAHIPWVTARGAVAHDQQQRSQSVPVLTWGVGHKRAHEPSVDFVRSTDMSAGACVERRGAACDVTTPLGSRGELRRKMTQRLAAAACVEVRGAAWDMRIAQAHDARGALSAPTTPSVPSSPGASARAGSATLLEARGELRRKMTQRLARSTALTSEPAEPSGFGRFLGSCL